MIPYIVTFISAFMVTLIAEKQKSIKDNKILTIFFLIIAASILSMLAALRGETIGTDVRTYVIRFFNGARSYDSFIKYLSFYPLDYVELGYKFFNYIISRFTDDIRVLHFAITFFDVSFVFAYLWENRKKMSISTGLLVFMLMQYNITFNAVRQSMAVCVCLYAFNAARDRRLKKFIILIILAFLFHRSSLIMIITYPLVGLFSRKTCQEKNRLIRILAIILITALVFINPIVVIMIKVRIFPSKFSHYIGESFSLSRFSAFIFLIPAFLIFKMYEKKFYEMDSFNGILFLYIIFWPIVAQLDSVSDQFGRMAYFFNIANIGLYAQLPVLQKNVKNKTNIRLIRAMLVIFLSAYWFINFYVWKTGYTVPYIFN